MPREAYQELDQLNIRINRLEEAVDCCLKDIAECRARLLDLRAQRSDLITTLLLPWALSIDSLVDETSTPAQPVSLRETIRRSVCAEPGDYKTVADRLGLKVKQVSPQLSLLHHRGDIGKSGNLFLTDRKVKICHR